VRPAPRQCGPRLRVGPGCDDDAVDPDLLDALDPEQRAVAEAVEGPVVVWAGAGTGKTRAVTYRIAHAARIGAHDPRRGLAVTFTTRAAGEMRERLMRLGVEGMQVRTFHAAALRQLRHFWPRAIGGQPYDVVSRVAPLVAEAASQCGLTADTATVRDLIAEVAWAKQVDVDPERYPARAAHRSPPMAASDVARVYAAYDALKADRHVMDFDDVLLMTVGMLEERPDIADEVRAAYRWFTVDEFQDVSPLQQRLLDLWLGERRDVCVVGDAAQTIYSFAGATDTYLRDFPTRFPDATQVRLVRDYRSTEPIVALANAVLAASGGGDALLVSQAGPGPQPRILDFDDEVAEATAVAAQIAGLIESGIAPESVAILVRINALMPAFEEALTELGLPIVLRGGERFFERGEVREAITRLRGAARGTPATDEPLADRATTVLSAMGWSPEAPRTTGAVRERWESLASLVDLARSHGAQGGDLASLITELDRRAAAQHAPVARGITLATIHAAKGLEWEAVVVAGCAEGSFPHAQAATADQLAEERRLFYVAITRAKRELTLTWSRSRQPGGRGSRQPSRFLAEVAADSNGAATSATSGHVRRGRASRRPSRQGPAACRACGRSLVTGTERARLRCRTCPPTASEATVERLRAWRLERAREREVPAYVIFTDATMEALAEALPGDAEELLAITGIGPDKIARYGDELLTLLAEERAQAADGP
jgi:DNA helicase II / ATP-dependent DNA helicase PcrA